MKKSLVSTLAVIFITGAACSVKPTAPSQQVLDQADAALVAKIEGALVETLQDDVDLTKRFGAFVRLEGSGYKREHAFDINDLYFERTAVFASGEASFWVMLNYCYPSPDLAERTVTVRHVSPKNPQRTQYIVDVGIGMLPKNQD